MHVARITSRPWTIPAEGNATEPRAGTGLTLYAPAGGSAIQLPGERLPLPEKCAAYHRDGLRFANYWIPGSAHQTERQYVLPTGERLSAEGFIPKVTATATACDHEETRETALMLFVEELVRNNQHLRWKAEELNGVAELAWQWVGRKQPCMPLAWQDMLSTLTVSDEPRMELVVRFINQVGGQILKLAEHPRQVLRRQRRMEHVGRVQQMDSNCLAWLVRQPGRTALEKAGSRQEIMAVVRNESLDTLENRVLRDLMLRAERAAGSWLRTNSKHSESKVFKVVGQFVRKVRKALRTGPLEPVGALNTLPTPNYVLRQDQAYRHVWTWYLKFVQQQSDMDDAWPWQERLWSETAALFLATALYSMGADGYEVENPMAQSLWVREKPVQGRWQLDTCWPGPLLLSGKKKRSAVMLAVNQIRADSKFAAVNLRDWGGTVNAEYMLILQSVPPNNAAKKLIAVWSLLALDHLPEHVLESYCKEAAQHLGSCSLAFAGDVTVEGLIIASGQCSASDNQIRMAQSTVSGIRVTGVAPANVISEADEFMGLLRMVLVDALEGMDAD